MNIGIIGNGFVGKATGLLNNSNVNLLVYDVDETKCIPINTTLLDISKCDLVFICVPTPMNKGKDCNISIVESIVEKLKGLNDKVLIVIRSTVIPGTSDKLNVYFMPEFLTEAKWSEDFYNTEHWIFGRPKNHDKLFDINITNLFSLSKKENKIKYDNIHFVENKEAEMLKYFKNVYLALKVSFANEMYDYCCKKEIDYDIVKDLVKLDSRITGSHLNVPGPDGKRGYGGTCFPKDTNALAVDMEKNKVNSIILNSIIKRNETIDRPEKEWMSNIGRTVTE
jgi:nucleotide sugar dehydrogenase